MYERAQVAQGQTVVVSPAQPFDPTPAMTERRPLIKQTAMVNGIVHSATNAHWVRRTSRQGLTYYWNPKTNQTQWQHPFSGAVDPQLPQAQQQNQNSSDSETQMQNEIDHVSLGSASKLDTAAFNGTTMKNLSNADTSTAPKLAARAPPPGQTTPKAPMLANTSIDKPNPAVSEVDSPHLPAGSDLATAANTPLSPSRSATTADFQLETERPDDAMDTLDIHRQLLPRHSVERAQQAELAETILELQARHKVVADEWTDRFLQKQEELSSTKEKFMTEKMEMLQELSELKQKAISDYYRGQQEATQKQTANVEARQQQLAEEHAKTLALQQRIHEESLQALQDENSRLEEHLQHANDRIAELSAQQSAAVSAPQSSADAETQQEQQRENVAAITRELEAEQQARIHELKQSHAAQVGKLRQQLDHLAATIEARVVEAVTEAEQKAKAEANQLREAMAAQVQEVREMERAKAQAELAALTAERDAARAMYQREMRERRKLANEIIDLKGNIRVLARIRPIQAPEIGTGQESVVVQVVDSESGEIKLVDPKGRPHSFRFDSAFGPDSTQMDIFAAVKPLSDTVLDGYNVCIFAYGQTGSGKTYTMQGIEGDLGVTHRALESIFDTLSERQQFGSISDVHLQVSVLEVYNESIRDLLARAGGGAATAAKSLELQRDRAGVMQVLGLSRTEVQCADDVITIVEQALQTRSTGATDANEHSSRSHLVISLYCSCKHANGVKTSSKLHLIDLAGSERVGKTAASGERLKEAQHINKSLLALGDVIDALGSKRKSHVPYRNSKLTHLLSDSLSGGSKVLMVVNTSPAQFNASESLCSLRFAERCRTTELGQAHKTTEK